MPRPELPVLLSEVLSACGMAYAPHSRSELDGQVTLVGQLLRPGLSPMDVVLYASEDMEAFGLHLWPASQEDAPAQDAPGVLFEVVEEWTFIQPVMFRLFPLEALALVTKLEGRILTLPGQTPLQVEVPGTLILSRADSGTTCTTAARTASTRNAACSCTGKPSQTSPHASG